MSFTTTGKNTALDALTLTTASLHTAFPGQTGTNEVTGGAPAYARKAITVNAASGGSRALNAGVTFDVPACTVRWVGFWNGATFNAYAPNGGTPKEFIVDTAADTVRSLAHGFSDTTTIVFYGDTVPAGLTEGTVYYVRDATTDTFKVAATSGGSAIDLTTAGGSACLVSKIFEDVYAAQDTHTLSAATFGLLN
jgi:hypothetical protein